MNKIISTIGAVFVAIVIAFTTWAPASAAPAVAEKPHVSASVELAQYNDKQRPRWRKNNDRRNRHERIERRHDRRGYWNGHRGYREHRRGYRRHSDGYYYPPSVFRLFIQ